MDSEILGLDRRNYEHASTKMLFSLSRRCVENYFDIGQELGIPKEVLTSIGDHASDVFSNRDRLFLVLLEWRKRQWAKHTVFHKGMLESPKIPEITFHPTNKDRTLRKTIPVACEDTSKSELALNAGLKTFFSQGTEEIASIAVKSYRSMIDLRENNSLELLLPAAIDTEPKEIEKRKSKHTELKVETKAIVSTEDTQANGAEKKDEKKMTQKKSFLPESDDIWMKKDIYPRAKVHSSKLVTTPETMTDDEGRSLLKTFLSENTFVIHAWIGQRKKTENIIVAIVNSKASNGLKHTFRGWTVLYRLQYEISEENASAEYSELCKSMPISYKDEKRFQKVISDYGEKLIANHTELRSITASSVRSRFYGTTDYHLIPQFCVVLGVQVKSVIPRGEKPFPTYLDGIPVDVRESYFKPAMNTGALGAKPKGTLKFASEPLLLKMGDRIAPDGAATYGTLGGYVELDGGIGAISTCHTFFSNRELGKWTKEKRENESRRVVRVGKRRLFDDIGRVERPVFKNGEAGTTSVDACIIRMSREEYVDQSGGFHFKNEANLLEAGFTPEIPPVYDDGTVTEFIKSEQRDYPVVKSGAKTGFTRTCFHLNGLAVKHIEYTVTYDEKRRFTYTMYQQIAVRNEKSLFAKGGDSGALTFMRDQKSSRLICFGLLVGITDTDAIITPIKPVFESLKLPFSNGLKIFKKTPLFQPEEEQQLQQTSMGQALGDEVGSDLRSSCSVDQTSLHESVGNVDEGVAQHLSDNRENTSPPSRTNDNAESSNRRAAVSRSSIEKLKNCISYLNSPECQRIIEALSLVEDSEMNWNEEMDIA